MRTVLLAGAAALTVTALPATLNAQDATTEAAPQPTNTQTADEANAKADPAPQTTTVTTTATGRTTVTSNNPGNLSAPPPQAFNKTYPVCTRTLQDNCQNPGEGGAPGKSRALGYWPGEPASERTDRGG